MILADVEMHRFGMQDDLLKLIERTGIPVAATILGKSVISEQHPLYLGIYEGAMGRDEVRAYVEESDCVIDARRLHDRHQSGHFHRAAGSGKSHLRHEREVSPFAITPSRMSGLRISCAAFSPPI